MTFKKWLGGRDRGHFPQFDERDVRIAKTAYETAQIVQRERDAKISETYGHTEANGFAIAESIRSQAAGEVEGE